MASVLNSMKSGGAGKEFVPPLEPGDHLDQKTFHERYEAMPDGIKAELIGGIVYMPSPMKIRHGRMSPQVMTWLATYSAATPGTETLENATIKLGPHSEPQPDGCLIISPACGGQTSVELDNEGDGYIVGPPELAAELASSSESYDLHSKKSDYEQAGIQEYLVINLRASEVLWFRLRGGRYEPLPPHSGGIIRSEVFPGLWLEAKALLRRDTTPVLDALRRGLATREHARFVAQLTAAERSS